MADDLADEPGLSLQEREEGLKRIQSWIARPKQATHPFWLELEENRKSFQIPENCFSGLLKSLEMEMKALKKDFLFESWEELNLYIQGVACDVGEAVLCILEKPDAHRKEYAQAMGRCVQYLNILRDLEEDERNGRRYYPREALRLKEESESALREFLFQEAESYYERAQALPYRSWISELMINFYRRGARHYWRYGLSRRLSRREKAQVALKTLFKRAF